MDPTGVLNGVKSLKNDLDVKQVGGHLSFLLQTAADQGGPFFMPHNRIETIPILLVILRLLG